MLWVFRASCEPVDELDIYLKSLCCELDDEFDITACIMNMS